MSLPRGYKAKANRLALQVREQMALAPTDPIDPWAVCTHFDIAVFRLSDLRSADGSQPGLHFLGAGRSVFSALTMPSGRGRAIVHNDSHGLPRQRSNITHELAHCFLGHPLTPPLLANGDRDRHTGVEEEAAFLGGALLIPNEAAVHIISTGMSASVATAHYGVSLSMLTYRLRVSGAQRIVERSAARAAAAIGCI